MDSLNRLLKRVPTWTIYLLGTLPLFLVAWQTSTAIDPVRAIEWGLGLWAVRLLIATLFISPLRWAGLNLLRFRRQFGLVAFTYVVLHFTAWLTIDMDLRWSQILPDLYKRWYILVGMSALLLLLPLALTSNATSIRRLAWPFRKTRCCQGAAPSASGGSHSVSDPLCTGKSRRPAVTVKTPASGEGQTNGQ